MIYRCCNFKEIGVSDLSRINTNLFSLRARAELSLSNRRLAKTLQRIATGKRIVRAEDDAAGFSIAAKLNARIGGISQALNNTSDAKSMFAIAENSLVQINDVLTRIKKKTIQASNAIPGAVERDFIRNEINGLALEINEIIDQTTFNGISLLDGTFSGQFQVGERSADTLSTTLDADLTVQDLQVFEVSTAGLLTSNSTITTGTNLNDLDQFQAIQGGDQFDIVLTQGDGTQITETFTASGGKGELTTSTIQDVIDAINNTGLFTAVFDSGMQAIEVHETTVTPGNGLNVELTNFSEFPGTDGAIASLNFNFDASTGNLRTDFTASGPINGSTRLNDLNQFNELEGQDELTLNLTDRDGNTQQVFITLPGPEATPSNFTINDLTNEINAQAGGLFTAAVDGSGQIALTEDNIGQFNLNASATFFENDTDEGSASVSATSFNQFTDVVESENLSGLNTTDTLNSTALGSNFDTGDTFDVVLTANDGSSEMFQFTFTSPNDTVGDLINEISSNTNFSANLSGGEIQISEDSPTLGGNLDVAFTNFNDASGNDAVFNGETFSGEPTLTSEGDLSPVPFSTSTLLNDLDQFTNVQGGDTLNIQVAAADGTDQSFVFTFDGDPAGPSTSTVQDLINSINSNTTLNASFNAGDSTIRVADNNSDGNNIALSFADNGFTEAPRPLTAVTPSPPLSFNFNGSGTESDVLQSSGTPAGLSTRINDLDGYADIQGGDRLRITLRNRANQTRTVNFNFNDVPEGVNSNRTVGELVNFLDGQTVNGVEMSAQLSGGRIVIEEVNPPNVGSLGTDFSFSEEDIDITPKNFTNIDFMISDFLRMSDSTGLVVGLNLLDFDAGNQLTQEIAQLLIQNVEDSIDRVINQINKIGNFQLQLSNRELMLSQARISNSAALSRIEDADFAREFSNLIRQSLLQQTQIATLAQANLIPRTLIDLL